MNCCIKANRTERKYANAVLNEITKMNFTEVNKVKGFISCIRDLVCKRNTKFLSLNVAKNKNDCLFLHFLMIH